MKKSYDTDKVSVREPWGDGYDGCYICCPVVDPPYDDPDGRYTSSNPAKTKHVLKAVTIIMPFLEKDTWFDCCPECSTTETSFTKTKNVKEISLWDLLPNGVKKSIINMYPHVRVMPLKIDGSSFELTIHKFHISGRMENVTWPVSGVEYSIDVSMNDDSWYITEYVPHEVTSEPWDYVEDDDNGDWEKWT